MKIQTRSEETGIKDHATLSLAFEEAKKDKTIWKISFEDSNGLNVPCERIRLVRSAIDERAWIFSPLSEEINETLKERGFRK